MEENVGPFHIPQQSIRHKLRLTSQNDKNTNGKNNHHHHLEFPLLPIQQNQLLVGGGGLNLSLSTDARCCVGAYNATPVGPFTGYASILGRSRFLRPTQELLEELCCGNNGVFSFEKDGWMVLEDSRSLFGDDEIDVSHGCNNPTLLSMLHEVYKRYKVYCQQMNAAVKSFESVAGLANAAPFACFAIKAMFRHFHCLKNAILDHIRFTAKVFGGADVRKFCSENRSKDIEQQQRKQVVDPNFVQHPVWRSQRGFPDKAVSVLRAWLFEHFLHPYPSDSDKQMLAQKTGLSRSQVSNWFTNARVRLWKPMVEEMHALDKKPQFSKDADTSRYVHASNDHGFSMHPHLAQRDIQIRSHMNHDQDHDQNQGTHCKRTRIEEFPRIEQDKEHFGTFVPCNQILSSQTVDITHPSVLGNNLETTNGPSWSTPAHQIVPLWLAKH